MEALATCPDPAEHHATLRARGVHRRGAAWVVARPDDVAAALSSPSLGVAPADPPTTDTGRLQARMARFSDGADHARRRALLEAMLPGTDGLEQAAAQRSGALLDCDTAVLDLMPVARTVPVAVLTAALGVPPSSVERVVTLTGQLCDALAPRLATAAAPTRPDPDHQALTALLAPLGPWDEEQVAAAVGILFQARDATAALVGTAALYGDREPNLDVDGQLDLALRQNAPVQCTRRRALTEVTLGGSTIPRGADVWVVLAAAERGGTTPPATFGAGPHACPGSSLARTLARGVLRAVRDRGLRPVPGQPVEYEQRPNLRLPARFLVARP